MTAVGSAGLWASASLRRGSSPSSSCHWPWACPMTLLSLSFPVWQIGTLALHLEALPGVTRPCVKAQVTLPFLSFLFFSFLFSLLTDFHRKKGRGIEKHWFVIPRIYAFTGRFLCVS